MKERQLISTKTSNLKPPTPPVKFVFFGTAEFSLIVLKGLIDRGFPPTALVCNPDRPVGRKKVITPPLTKQFVINEGLDIPIHQPENKEELLDISGKLFDDAGFGIVASYSTIIPREVIRKAKLGIIGVHPSLLPKLRGPSPVQSAILSGVEATGISLFLLDEEVDHGRIIAAAEHLIRGNDTFISLRDSLAELAGQLLGKVIPEFVEGKIDTRPQDESQATHTQWFVSQDGYIETDDFDEAKGGNKGKAIEIFRKIRALNPEPGVYTFIDEKRTKLLGGELKDGKLVLTKIQREGRKPIEL